MNLNRRQFLRHTTLGAVGVTLAEPLLGSAGKLLAAPAPNKCVVVVNLNGGNDGLNTVVPINQYARYVAMRKGTEAADSIVIPQANLLPISGQPDFGLNPGLTAFQNLYAQGKLAIINGVGVPKSASNLFDHSAQQYEMQTCDVQRAASSLAPTGWLGRYLDDIDPLLVSPGIDMGGGSLMLTGNTFSPLAIDSLDELRLQFSFDDEARRASYERVMAPTNADPTGEYNRQLRVTGLAQSDSIRRNTENYVPAVQYPNTGLARSLRQCAKIISGNLGVVALTVGEGGFDSHSNQLVAHNNLLKRVADAVGAFYADLVAHNLADRVVILTMSEFGRTPWVNSEGGTDHGFSSVAFAIGGSVHGGIYGTYPSLADGDLVLYDCTDMTTDFRSVYSTVFANFLNVDPVPLVGGTFPVLGFV
jgi:uncharacterized protein (DUF1501 family)